MPFKDEHCTCDSYCTCTRSKPCVCDNMKEDPHCEWCLEHLHPEDEIQWMNTPHSKCCKAAVEERVLQTYSGSTVLKICSACGNNCEVL